MLEIDFFEYEVSILPYVLFGFLVIFTRWCELAEIKSPKYAAHFSVALSRALKKII